MAALYRAHTIASSLLSTGLDGLTNGTRAISAEQSNDQVAERTLFGNFILNLGTTSAKTGTIVEMWIVREVDGVYQSGGVTDEPTSGYVGSFVFPKTTSAWVDVLFDVKLPNSKYKIVLKNSTGVALAATGNTLKVETTTYEDA